MSAVKGFKLNKSPKKGQVGSHLCQVASSTGTQLNFVQSYREVAASDSVEILRGRSLIIGGGMVRISANEFFFGDPPTVFFSCIGSKQFFFVFHHALPPPND